MKRCFDSKQWHTEAIMGLILYPLLIMFFIAVTIIAFLVELHGFAIFSLFFASALMLYFVFDLAYQWRKYRVDKNGITITYFNYFQSFYSWNSFREIVVCDISHAGNFPSICHLVIRLANYNEFSDPHSKNNRYTRPHIQRWRSGWYNQIRFHKIVCLTFSPDRLDEIQSVSKLPVRYSLTIYGKEDYENKQKTERWIQ